MGLQNSPMQLRKEVKSMLKNYAILLKLDFKQALYLLFSVLMQQFSSLCGIGIQNFVMHYIMLINVVLIFGALKLDLQKEI